MRAKKRFIVVLTIFLVIILSGTIPAQEVDKQTANKAAAAWLKKEIVINKEALQKGYKYTIPGYKENIIEIRHELSKDILAFVIELDPAGFIIMSPDRKIKPVIGYSLTSRFVPDESPHNTLLYLIRMDMSKRIKAVR